MRGRATIKGTLHLKYCVAYSNNRVLCFYFDHSQVSSQLERRRWKRSLKDQNTLNIDFRAHDRWSIMYFPFFVNIVLIHIWLSTHLFPMTTLIIIPPSFLRLFRLRLRPSADSVFAPDVSFESTRGTINFPTHRVLEGTLEGKILIRPHIHLEKVHFAKVFRQNFLVWTKFYSLVINVVLKSTWALVWRGCLIVIDLNFESTQPTQDQHHLKFNFPLFDAWKKVKRK